MLSAYHDIYVEIKEVLMMARTRAYSAVNVMMVQAYWQVGRIIVEHEQKGKEFGKGFDVQCVRNRHGRAASSVKSKGQRIMNLHEMKAIVSKLAERYGVARVLLFGSRAKGNERPDSDYDFLITNGNLKSLLQFAGFWQDLEEAFNAPVDVVTDTSFDEDLIAEAKRDGILIYEIH